MDISIITTVKNNSLGIFPTIQSVLKQKNYKKIEYIIIDASTSPKTSMIIKDLIKNKKVKYIHSKDNNLYDGLNKGIKMATGKYIGILNSSDIYYDSNVLEVISKVIKKSDSWNLICGNVIFFNKYEVTRHWKLPIFKNQKIDCLKIPHSSSFIKRKLLIKNKLYSTNFTISSDLDFFLRSRKDLDFNTLYINKNLIFMRDGGLSTSALVAPIKIAEDLCALFMHYNVFFIFFYFRKILLKFPSFFPKKSDFFYRELIKRFLELSKK